jgi:hypothetical protein
MAQPSLTTGESTLRIQVLDSAGVVRSELNWQKLDKERLIELEVALLEAVISVGKAHL